MRITRSRLLLFLVIARATISPVGAQIRPVRVQCYGLEVGMWRPALRTDAPYHRLPAIVRLDTLRWPRTGWHLEPDMKYPGARRFPETPRWEAAGDTIKLVWSNGFTPTRVSLVRDGPVLKGEAVAETDVHELVDSPRPRAAVTAHPVACGGSATGELRR